MQRTRRILVVIGLVVLASVGGGIGAAEPTGATDGPAAAGEAVAPWAVSSGMTQADCDYPVTVTDATGTEVTIEERPERIVALQPSDAQVLFEIDADDRVVGMPINRNTAYINDTEGITNVKNTDGTVNVEQVTNLSADVVIAANVTRSGTIEQLRSTNATVYHVEQIGSMDGIYEYVNTTGRIVGNCGAATERVGQMQDRLAAIDSAIGEADRPAVLYAFYGYTTGEGTHIHDAIVVAGGENVAATAGISGYGEISREVVAATQVDWIVHPSTAPAPTGAPYNQTVAFEEDRVFSVNANYISQPGPRVVDAVESMAQRLHPEAFDENGEPITPTPTAMPTATPTTTQTMADGGATTPNATTTGDAGPGFGPLPVVVALATGLLVLGRRRKGV